jgi:hypothetical protein
MKSALPHAKQYQPQYSILDVINALHVATEQDSSQYLTPGNPPTHRHSHPEANYNVEKSF